MKHITEQKRLLSLLDKEVWNLLEHHNAIVAGGAITSLFCNREINDVDVYFRCEEDLVRVLASIFNIDEIYDYEIDQFHVHVSGLSQRTIMCSVKEKALQLMTFKYFPDVQDIFDTFDFTCCMGAYDCKSKEFIFHPEFFKHNSQRYLKFNPGTAYPLMSLMRVDKYREKGYTISKSEMLRVVFACMELKINSWEEAKEHIGGMYGYDMSKAFDEGVDFSMGSLIDQLGNLQQRGAELYSPANQMKDFWELSEILFYKPSPEDIGNRPKFNDSKYLYKCVDSKYQSKWSGGYTPVHYKEGEILDISSIGSLYFHGSSVNTFATTDYWVECEVLDGFVEEICIDKKRVKSGKVKVVRTFEYSPARNPVKKYMIGKYGVEETE